MSDLEERYKTCGRCVHDGEGNPNISGSTCYLCKRNPEGDHRIDWFEEKKEEKETGLIHMSGRVLLFDKVSKNGVLFPKDCKISFPEKVPVTWEFRMYDPSEVLGIASVSKDEKGLNCVVELTNFDPDLLHKDFHDELPIGGFYTRVKRHMENGITVVDEASLKLIGVTLGPADDELKIRVVKGE